MKNVDYIIVGDGYAGLFFAHQLIKQNKKFVLFSGSKKGASQVSAGVVNPVVLKKFTTFWLAAEQIKTLRVTMAELETYLPHKYFIDQQIHRIFHDETEKELWLNKSRTEELNPFLNPEFAYLETIKNPFGTGSVDYSARLNVEQLFPDFLEHLNQINALSASQFDFSALRDHQYKEISFKNIVFCEGMSVRQNPFFKDIEVIANKGHHLKVKLSEKLNHEFTLKKKHFLFPLSNDLHYYGGTYDPNERQNEVDDFKREELIEGLEAFYPNSFQVVEVNYGFRPTVKDRRPIIGNHPLHKNYYVFNGLGARGILNGCYFSRELFEHIENGKELMAEVDIKRFDKRKE